MALGPSERKENIEASRSPGCISSPSQLIVRPSSRGGVPVFNRPIGRPNPSIRSAKRIDALSPIRPPERDSWPICMTPRKNVPVVRITVAPDISLPSASTTPPIWLLFIIKSETSASITSKLSQFLNSACIIVR